MMASPPSFCMAAMAGAEKAWAVIVILVLRVPLPKILYRLRLSMRPCAASICASMVVDCVFSVSCCSVSRLMGL